MGCNKNRRERRRRQGDRINHQSTSGAIAQTARVFILSQQNTRRSGSAHFTSRYPLLVHRQRYNYLARTLQQSHTRERDRYKPEMRASVADGCTSFDVANGAEREQEVYGGVARDLRVFKAEDRPV